MKSGSDEARHSESRQSSFEQCRSRQDAAFERPEYPAAQHRGIVVRFDGQRSTPPPPQRGLGQAAEVHDIAQACCACQHITQRSSGVVNGGEAHHRTPPRSRCPGRSSARSVDGALRPPPQASPGGEHGQLACLVMAAGPSHVGGGGEQEHVHIVERGAYRLQAALVSRAQAGVHQDATVQAVTARVPNCRCRHTVCEWARGVMLNRRATRARRRDPHLIGPGGQGHGPALVPWATRSTSAAVTDSILCNTSSRGNGDRNPFPGRPSSTCG